MANEPNVVYFAHGKESGPWGDKILAMAQIAQSHNFQVESPDYSAISNPDERVRHLLKINPSATQNLVLVGSSMGAYVSTIASGVLKPTGLFLLAPAFYKSGYEIQAPVPFAQKTVVIHGWRDDVIPVMNSIQFADQYKAELHILDSDHRLTSVLPYIEYLFDFFLKTILST